MAVTKPSGSRRATQRPPEVPASEISQRISRYTSMCEAAANLNRGFDQVLNEVERLSRMGCFWGEVSKRFPKTCRLMLEELRAWAMSDIAQDIEKAADGDWSRYGIERYRFEQKFRDPVDIRRELERVVKQLDERATERKTRTRNAISRS
jgi:hypothetical protein